MTACYVLASDRWNEHCSMLCVSAATLRHHHRDAEIVLVSDSLTRQRLAPYADRFAEFVSRWVSVPCESGDARERSRYVKTSLRRYVRGRIVFIDLDTLIMRPISGLFDSNSPLAIALDYERGVIDERDRSVYFSLGGPYPQWAYNSGVVVADDTPAVSEFFEEWHRRWQLTRALGRLDDQPSLNSAIATGGLAIETLPPEYNAMILYFPQRFRTCRIAHFLASTRMFRTLMNDLVASFEADGTVDWQLLRAAASDRHPWGRNPEAWQLVRSGNYLTAVVTKARTLRSR